LITENLSTLKINKLTQEQYDKALSEGKIKHNEIYLTPDESTCVKLETFGDGEHFVVENNKDYHADDYIATLTIVIPDDNILCSLMFTTVDSGTVQITIDGAKGYIGKAPDLEENGVTWELSIHNGIIASGKVVSE
jgi:hypothetical protein